MAISNLITGGAGLIGTNLTRFLLKKGEIVISIDTQENIFIDFFKKKFDNFFFYKIDVKNPIDFKVDKIWHLACNASPKSYLIESIDTLKTSFEGTLNILELAKKYNTRILLASSSEVYGDNKIYPQSESLYGNVNPFNERACYAEGKRISETLFYEYSKKFNIDIRVARIFNTYGSEVHSCDGRVITNFIHQALSRTPLTIYGDGSHQRSFCYVSDLVYGLNLLMQSDYTYPINLGNNQNISIFDLAKVIIQKTDNNLSINFQNGRFEDPKIRKPCIKRAKQILNWEPKISLNLGLDKTIHNIKKYKLCNNKFLI